MVPFTKGPTLKILHIRREDVNVEGPPRTSRGTLLQNWDMDSDDDSMADEDLGADPDPDIMTAYDDAPEDGSSNESASDDGEPPSVTHSTASLDSFDMYKMSRLPPKLREFATWAFGPDGLPTLEVLAFGDFSYDGQFEFHNKLFCRHTGPIRNLENDTRNRELVRKFRPVRGNDRELWDLIDRNKEFLEACPTNAIIND